MFARKAIYLENSEGRSASSSDPLFFGNLIDRGELARLLGVSPSFISKMMVEEGLPYFKIGRAVRYDVKSVKSWLLERKTP
jgi:excisionase family DNA binding protein